LIVVAGGRIRSSQTGTLVNTDIVEAYAPRSDSWHTLAKLTTGRGGLAVGTLNGVLYALGGESLGGGGSVYSVNRKYDTGTASWRLVASIPVAVHGTGAVTVGDTMYLLVGGTRAGVFSSDVAQAFVVGD
jgi:N-acetylneuraminic acid mutarotase